MDPLHEGIEQGHGERRIPVTRAVDHAAGDQRLPGRTHLLRRFPQGPGDVSRPMETRTASRHRVQTSLLRLRQPLVPRPEEIPVEAPDRGFARSRDVFPGDGRDRRRVPGLVSPFLEKIGIALGLANHRSDRFVVEFDIRLYGGLDQGAFRLGGLQSPDITNMKLRADRPDLLRWIARRASARTASRPASSGGGVPAPGA